jgi:alkylation response protein AidB-like acyl-CoA dehydrogenase
VNVEPRFPRFDPVGPDGPALPAAVDVIASEIEPRAADADLHGVQRSAIDSLARAGFHGSPLPSAAGQRELAELLAGSDASTWFCWVQHQSPMRALTGERAVRGGSAVEHRLLHDMQSGRLLSGVAFAHLRRPGPQNPSARRVPSGWIVDGSLDWVTSWDIADWFLLMVADADSPQVISAFLPAGRGQVSGAARGLIPGEPLQLLAMSGTHTRPIQLNRVFIHDEDVVAITDLDQWRAGDAIKTADANPATFGLIRGAVAELTAIAEQRSDRQLGEIALALVDDARECRRHAYAWIDASTTEGVHERLTLRARSLGLAQRATTAVLTARAGMAMIRGTSAERRAREALFMLVQAQTRQSRAAFLDLDFGIGGGAGGWSDADATAAR